MKRPSRKSRRRRGAKPRRHKRPAWHVVTAFAATVAAAVALGWGVRSALLAPSLRVERTVVVGNRRVSIGAVREAIAGALGQPILLLRLAPLREAVEAIPGVEQAIVARRLPDLIEVRLHERKAIARVEMEGEDRLVDDRGVLFPPGPGLPGDGALPLMRGLTTKANERELAPADRAGLAAIAALEAVTGRPAPAGTVVDLTPPDRIVLHPGPDAPALWLDREEPQRNLEQLFAWQDRIAALAPGRPVDLRFPHRLTVARETAADLRRR